MLKKLKNWWLNGFEKNPYRTQGVKIALGVTSALGILSLICVSIQGWRELLVRF